MRTLSVLSAGFGLAALIVASPALAVPAVVTTDLNMRAGPGANYPVVSAVPDDAVVDIRGCVEGYSWCDVVWRGRRGWVSGRFLAFDQGGSYAEVEEVGPDYGLPIIGFDVGTYWGRWYRDEPWYEQRFRWGAPRFREEWRDRREWQGGGDWRDRRDVRPQYPAGRLPQPGDRLPQPGGVYQQPGGALPQPPGDPTRPIFPRGGQMPRGGGAPAQIAPAPQRGTSGGRLPQPGDSSGSAGAPRSGDSGQRLPQPGDKGP